MLHTSPCSGKATWVGQSRYTKFPIVFVFCYAFYSHFCEKNGVIKYATKHFHFQQSNNAFFFCPWTKCVGILFFGLLVSQFVSSTVCQQCLPCQ